MSPAHSLSLPHWPSPLQVLLMSLLSSIEKSPDIIPTLRPENSIVVSKCSMSPFSVKTKHGNTARRQFVRWNNGSEG